MRILLVEDTPSIGKSIQEYLAACKMEVVRTKNVKSTLDVLQSQTFDCIILDWMLPDGSGEELAKHIRSFLKTPIIMATAKSQIEDKLAWFNSGVQDYITKPFDLRELEARIIAQTNTSHIENNSHELITWQDITIDIENMNIYQNNIAIHCTPTEWIIIKCLLDQPGKVVTRQELSEFIRWDEGTRSSDNKLDVVISNLRKKFSKQFIKTVKWYGYKISV